MFSPPAARLYEAPVTNSGRRPSVSAGYQPGKVTKYSAPTRSRYLARACSSRMNGMTSGEISPARSINFLLEKYLMAQYRELLRWRYPGCCLGSSAQSPPFRSQLWPHRGHMPLPRSTRRLRLRSQPRGSTRARQPALQLRAIGVQSSAACLRVKAQAGPGLPGWHIVHADM